MSTNAIGAALSVLLALSFSPPATASPSKSEALAFAKTLMASRVTSCSGRSFFWGKASDTTYLAEVNEPALNVAVDELSGADKLNGLDFKGTSFFRFKAIRLFDPGQKKWSDWSTLGFSSGESFAFAVVHEKKGWKHQPADLVRDFLASHESKAIYCSSIPKQ